MSFRKGNIIRLFFLVYFIIYVISPLCYAEDRLTESSAITRNAKYNIKNIRVIWELTLSRLFQKENQEDSRSGAHFFIKKARAVLCFNKSVKTLQPDSELPYLNSFVFNTENVSFLPPTKSIASQNLFLSIFSGLSPPFA